MSAVLFDYFTSLTVLHCCIPLYSPYFHIRMESLLVWRCSYPKRPSCTWTPAHHLSMTSSSTRLPTTETPPLSAKPLPLTHPPLMSSLNPPCPQNKPRKACVLTMSLSPGGTLHPGGGPHLVTTRRPAVTPHLGVIPPPTSTEAPPAPLPPLSCTEIWSRPQSTLGVGETTRVDEPAHPRHRLTSLGRLHHRHPG